MRCNLTKIVIALAAVIILAARFRLAAQNQPQPKQPPSRFTLATANYNLLIASGFLCEDADGCPAVAQAADGETIEITGAGTFALADKSVTAAGAFTQKTSSGAITATGVWTATRVVRFKPYGIAPFALLRDYPQLRTAGLFAMGRPMMPGLMMPGLMMAGLMAGPLAAGGLAVIRIRLLPDAGVPQDALLQVSCAKSKAPETEQTDGVKLTISGGPAFNLPVSGRAVFLLLRPMPNFPWKATSHRDSEE
jgi:hypothetical protein